MSDFGRFPALGQFVRLIVIAWKPTISLRFFFLLFAQLWQWENYRLKGNDYAAQLCKAYPATDFLSRFGWLSAVFGVPSRAFVVLIKIDKKYNKKKVHFRAQEVCGSRGGRADLPVPDSQAG